MERQAPRASRRLSAASGRRYRCRTVPLEAASGGQAVHPKMGAFLASSAGALARKGGLAKTLNPPCWSS
eukprot:8373342-Pyramimonas_sp.AAC.1